MIADSYLELPVVCASEDSQRARQGTGQTAAIARLKPKRIAVPRGGIGAANIHSSGWEAIGQLDLVIDHVRALDKSQGDWRQTLTYAEVFLTAQREVAVKAPAKLRLAMLQRLELLERMIRQNGEGADGPDEDTQLPVTWTASYRQRRASRRRQALGWRRAILLAMLLSATALWAFLNGPLVF
ncbi:MAG: hypothetical protein H6707_09375 [Deltaproteobacteria bacterium]|nr:hypothetical protein [Deltaproteobacteria bacterium]